MSDRDSAPGSYVGLVPLNETPEHALALFLPREGTARGQLAAKPPERSRFRLRRRLVSSGARPKRDLLV